MPQVHIDGTNISISTKGRVKETEEMNGLENGTSAATETATTTPHLRALKRQHRFRETNTFRLPHDAGTYKDQGLSEDGVLVVASSTTYGEEGL